jgi:site-specific recombinase XerD
MMTWRDFRDRYDLDVLDAMRVSTAVNYSATLNVF